LDRLIHPPAPAIIDSTYASASGGAVAVGGSSNPYVDVNCESGGDPTAVSADGLYRGKYQFSQSTWEAHGGVGDPAAAAEAVQDQIAANVTTDEWPNC
jgi:hypothetical protein